MPLIATRSLELFVRSCEAKPQDCRQMSALFSAGCREPDVQKSAYEQPAFPLLGSLVFGSNP